MTILQFACGVASIACAPARTPPPDDLGPRFQRILEDSARANGVIGAQAVVLIPGRPAWSGVTGEERPGIPMRPDRMIGTGSISKLISAVAAMVLVDRGRFTLDDTVGRWFPNTPNVPSGITVRQLMRQTSGIADYSANPRFVATIRSDRNHVFTPTELLGLIEAPRFAPDHGWEASNSNRILLGFIVERESGTALGPFIRQELFGGSRTVWTFGEGKAPDHLASQWSAPANGPRVDFKERWFGPAIYTGRLEVQASAADLAAFGARLLGGDLLSPAMREAMLTIVPDDGRIPGQTGGGLGIRRFTLLGRTLYGHSGGTSNGSALFLFDPATRIVAAIAVNQDGPSHRQSHFRIVPALLQAAIDGTSDRH